MKEFSHIELRLVRNPEWLKQFEKQGFFLSETFPLSEVPLPEAFKDMEEKDLDDLILWLSHSALIGYGLSVNKKGKVKKNDVF